MWSYFLYGFNKNYFVFSVREERMLQDISVTYVTDLMKYIHLVYYNYFFKKLYYPFKTFS